MPPKSRFRNRNKHKNTNSPQNHNQNNNQNSNSNHFPFPHNQRNRGRSRSRSRSRKPWQKPSPQKHTPLRPPFSRPATPPSSPSRSLASKATHTLRSTVLSSPTGILKRRISLGLSLTLPSSAAAERLKALLLKAVDEARECVGRMDFSCSSSSNPVTFSPEVPISINGDEDWGDGVGEGEGMTQQAWRASAVAMDGVTVDDAWDDVDGDAGGEEIGKGHDHGCVDIVREHGQYVQRMRWEATDGEERAQPPTGPKKMTGRKAGSKAKQSKNRNEDLWSAEWGDEEVM